MTTRAKSTFTPTSASSPSSIPKSNTALLICDVQNLTISHLDSDPATRHRILNTTLQLQTWALSNSVPVYHCTIDTSSPPAPHARIGERWNAHAIKIKENPELGAMVSDLTQQHGPILSSRAPGLVSALSASSLVPDLESRQIRSLIVVGISTSGCVFSTVRDANERGYVVTIVEDGCADPKEGIHEALCGDVLPMTAHVVKGLSDVMGIWKGSTL